MTRRACALLVVPFICLLLSSVPSHAEDSLFITFSVDDDLLRIETSGDSGRVITAPLVSAHTEAGRFSLGDRFQVSSDTMYIGDQAISFHRLGSMDVERVNGHVEVKIYDRGPNVPAPMRLSHRIASSETLHVDSGEFVRGFVLGFGSRVDVAGEVNRSVVAVGGDVTVEPGAVVRGSVVALGGDVDKSDDARVYGDLYADNRQLFRPHWYEAEQSPVDFHVALDYHRASGGLMWAGAEAGPRSGWAPRLAGELGYAFWPELWHYRIGVRRESIQGPLYYLGFHRDTKDDDAQIIRRHENTIFALLFGEDYRDYYFTQGFSASLGWSLAEQRRLSVTYVQEDLTALEAHQKQWSLFNSGSFQRNYETLWRQGDSSFLADFNGKLSFLRTELSYQLPEYAMRREGTWNLDMAFEVADSSLGSDFEYTRYGGRLARTQPTWTHQELRARISASASGGSLPATRTAYLGGIGSLRGFDHKEFLGDRFWFLNLEYGWLWENLEVFALYDAGQIDGVYADPGSTVLHDVGLGVQIQRTFRVQMAVDARFERPPLITVRFAKAP